MPTSSQRRPEGQEIHSDAPIFGWYVPFQHKVATPLLQYDPLGHKVPVSVSDGVDYFDPGPQRKPLPHMFELQSDYFALVLQQKVLGH